MQEKATLVWLRRDLRLSDNEALLRGARRGVVIPVFIWSPEEEGDWRPGGASRWWLGQSLLSLANDLEKIGSRLILRQGNSLAVLRELLSATGADAVMWNRLYEPWAQQRDAKWHDALTAAGAEVEIFSGNSFYEPWAIQTKAGKPYQVYTPFWRALMSMPAPAEPRESPRALLAPARWPASLTVEKLSLIPPGAWPSGLAADWSVGERAAARKWNAFLHRPIESYMVLRDRPDVPGTSRLSPHLQFGEISVRRLWHDLRKTSARGRMKDLPAGATTFLRELAWREFAQHLLHHFPNTTSTPLRGAYAKFPWRKGEAGLRVWQKGRTGYPIVDAGMRQLWATGWMHNRVRMIVASFLVKDLMLPWQDGARWFWDTLVDADLANNTLGWQWSAGCGADAAPYFRIFNPVLQGLRFDPDGQYVRRWVPELAKLSGKWIHQPWKASPKMLMDAGVVLGRTYPKPMVDHAVARERALAAWRTIRPGERD